jgi:hypothetical protein
MDFGIVRMLEWEKKLEIRSEKNGFRREAPAPLPAEEAPEAERDAPERPAAVIRQKPSCECA